jgi:hypothetical protein
VGGIAKHHMREVFAVGRTTVGEPAQTWRLCDPSPDLFLKELDARIQTDAAPDGLPFDHDAAPLGRAEMWNLICPHGEFDISFRPAAFEGGFSPLAAKAHRVKVAGVEVLVADLDDVVRSKEDAVGPRTCRSLPLSTAIRQVATLQEKPLRRVRACNQRLGWHTPSNRKGHLPMSVCRRT